MKRRGAVWLMALTAGALLLAVAVVRYQPRPSISYAVQTEETAPPPDANSAKDAKAQDETWPEWTDPKNKIVPIISIGTPGLRLGAAQVTGPADRVEQVKSVVQLDALFKKAARVYIYVPSSELVGMNRVQGVAVTALLEYKLMRF